MSPPGLKITGRETTKLLGEKTYLVFTQNTENTATPTRYQII